MFIIKTHKNSIVVSTCFNHMFVVFQKSPSSPKCSIIASAAPHPLPGRGSLWDPSLVAAPMSAWDPVGRAPRASEGGKCPKRHGFLYKKWSKFGWFGAFWSHNLSTTHIKIVRYPQFEATTQPTPQHLKWHAAECTPRPLLQLPPLTPEGAKWAKWVSQLWHSTTENPWKTALKNLLSHGGSEHVLNLLLLVDFRGLKTPREGKGHQITPRQSETKKLPKYVLPDADHTKISQQVLTFTNYSPSIHQWFTNYSLIIH